jgi:hypothetical protein
MDSPYGLLPELWQMIMVYLGPCSLLNCASVCKTWCGWARSDKSWARHVRRVRDKLIDTEFVHDWKSYRYILLEENDREPTGVEYYSVMQVPKEWGANYVYDHCVQYVHDTTRHLYNVYFPLLTVARIQVGDEHTQPMISTFFMTEKIKCTVNKAVDPKRFVRYNSIVRDNDCLGPRDERVWLTLSEK